MTLCLLASLGGDHPAVLLRSVLPSPALHDSGAVMQKKVALGLVLVVVAGESWASLFAGRASWLP